jgi:hypothetical protein
MGHNRGRTQSISEESAPAVQGCRMLRLADYRQLGRKALKAPSQQETH